MEQTQYADRYTSITKQRLGILIGLSLILIASILLATPTAQVSVSLSDVIQVLLSKIPFLDQEADPNNTAIIWEIRLPRILMAVIGGFGLAISGAATQGVLRNHMASPFTLGISSAACLGSVLAIFLNIEIAGSDKLAIVASSFLCGMGALLVIYYVSRKRGASPETVILCGIALMLMFLAISSSLSSGGRLGLLLWGSLRDISWDTIYIVLIIIVITLPFIIRRSLALNALALGDDVAQGVGVKSRRVRFITMVYATLIVSAIVSFTGLIGFICLIAPFIARRIMGNDYRFIFPCAGLLGALILLGLDTIGRNLIPSVDIPVAFLATIVGVPFLIYITLTNRGYA
ncbi:MAG: iron ABC transporter permease [Chloroflexota bacterium]|nr:iron ABC transporter permease [Chloroflexota bacterium]